MKARCRQVLRNAYLFMDREVLSEDERRSIQSHLEECRPCFEQYGLEREVTELIRGLRGHDICPERLKSRIASLLD